MGQKTSDRIGALRADLQAAEKLHRNGQTVEYEIHAQHIYGRLREAWERASEEILLAGVVERFSKKVQTQRLRYVANNEAQDYAELDAAMTKCSAQLPGHDQPAAVNAPTPTPNEIRQDIDKLENWATRIRARRQRS